MLDQAITLFFEKRKEEWIKKKFKASMTQDEVQTLYDETETRFSLGHWLPDAAKRASQISISSHPCTFSHPSARKNKNGYTSPIVDNSSYENDGFLRSGNIKVQFDTLGNAAAMDVYKFLTLTLEDGATLLSHLERDTETAQQTLKISTADYQSLKNSLLSMAHDQNDEIFSSSKIKQVYFPTKQGEYHLLSI